MPDSYEGGTMTVAHLQLVSVLVIVARWSTNLAVVFIIPCVYTNIIEDEA